MAGVLCVWYWQPPVGGEKDSNKFFPCQSVHVTREGGKMFNCLIPRKPVSGRKGVCLSPLSPSRVGNDDRCLLFESIPRVGRNGSISEE